MGPIHGLGGGPRRYRADEGEGRQLRDPGRCREFGGAGAILWPAPITSTSSLRWGLTARLEETTVKAPKPHFADDGGMADGDPGVDIAASDGEYVVPPQEVQRGWPGPHRIGHSMDQMVLNIRKHSIKTLRKMKPPKKS